VTCAILYLQVYHPSAGQFVCQNKYYGRKLSVPGFKEVLELFLYDGEHMRLELLDPILNRLKNLYTTVEKHDTFRFYSSSLLVMYGGKEGQNVEHSEDECEHMADNVSTSGQSEECGSMEGTSQAQKNKDINEDLVDVRMIDFAHSTHHGYQDDERHKGVDQGYLFGLQNLIHIFEDIKRRYSGSDKTEES